MPEIGEVRLAKELGSTAGRGYSKFIWHACVDCRKERWVPLVLGKPYSLKCFDCGIKRNLGAGNGQWKGDAIKTNGLHSWLHKYIPKPQYCERCKSVRPYDLACVTGKYNRDFQNWQWLCRRCHMLSDGRMLNLNQFRRPYQYKLIPDGRIEEMKLLEGEE